MAAEQNLFKRLTSLFRSGPIVKRKIQGFRSGEITSSALDVFRKSTSGVYGNALNAYGAYDRLSRYSDFCFHPDTLIYTTKGTHTIKELAEMYADGQRFHVYSYDFEKKKIVIGDAHSPRLSREGIQQKLVRVAFDGGYIDSTPDHKFMLRSGHYVEAQDLKSGMSLMPFTKKDIIGTGYQWIYTMDRENGHGGWEPEHRIVAERFLRSIEENEVVHHIDFNRENNNVENLCIMDAIEHKKYHAQLNNKNKFGKPNQSHSKWMRENNPVKRHDVTFERILELSIELDFTMSKVKKAMGVDANVLKRRLRERGFKNWADFKSKKNNIQDYITHEKIAAESKSPEIDEILEVSTDCETIYELCQKLSCSENSIRRRLFAHGYDTWSNLKEENGFDVVEGVGRQALIDETVSYQDICDAYEKSMTYHELAQAVGTTHNKVLARIMKEGFSSYYEWVNDYNNHKVMSVDFLDIESVVYNLTIDKYHNVAAGSVNSSDTSDKEPQVYVIIKQSEMEYTPEIASAVDIHCLAGNNEIPLLDGTTKTIKELYDSELSDFWLYSFDIEQQKFVPGHCKAVAKTGEGQDIYRVLLDDGSSMRLTSEHKVLLSDGTYKKVKDLLSDDSLQACDPDTKSIFYKMTRSVEKDGVEDVYDLCVEGFHNFAVGMDNGFVIVHNSEEAVAPDDKGRSLHVFSDNPKIKQLLEELFYDTLNVEFNLKGWIRNLCKYGDFFLFNDVSPEYGVINAFPIPVNEIEREEGYDPEDPMAVRFRWVTQGNQVLENWQVTHFRLLNNDAFLPYGSSILESARRIWRQLILIEDAMLVYRVIRAPERRVFYIDVANVPPTDVPNIIEQAKAKLKSQEVIDKDAGRVDLRYNPWCCSLQTLVPLMDGRTVSLGDLIYEWELCKESGSDRQHWVYSVDLENNHFVPGKIVWAGITKRDTQIIRVHLDNEKYIDVTPEHRFLLRDGTYIEAEKLEPGSSLMPLYRKWTSKDKGDQTNGYEKILVQRSKNKNPTWELTHRLNAINEHNSEPGQVVHHVDFDKHNNNPENLMWMDSDKHMDLHCSRVVEYNKSDIGRENSRHMKNMWAQGKFSSDVCKKMWQDPEIRKKRVDKLTLKIDYDQFLKFCMQIMDQLGTKMQTKESTFREALNADPEFQQHLKDLNPNFENGFNDKFLRGRLQKTLKDMGFKRAFTDLKRFWLTERYDVEDIIKFCESMNYEVSRKDVLEEFDLCRNDYQELVNLSGFDYSSFSSSYTHKSQDFQPKQPLNHKVVRIEWLEKTEDVGCITVEKYHNFAVAGSAECFDPDEVINSGIFIHNSVDIDYFLPVRGGETGTKIDTLPGGQNTTAIDDVEYIQRKLFAALKVPKAYLGFDEALCLHGDTKISLLDGRDVSIREIAKEYEEGKQNWVYSCDENGAVVPGKISWAGLTKKVNQLHKITLDNGEVILCTDNHPFLMRDSVYKEANDLQVGDSLMPLRRKTSSKKDGDKIEGYEKVFNPKKNKWEYTHRLVFESANSRSGEKNTVIHHSSFDKRNNNPDLLVEMDKDAHIQLHAAHLKEQRLDPAFEKKRKENQKVWAQSKENKALLQKISEEQQKEGTARYEWLHSDEHKEMSSEQMLYETTTPGRPLHDWIHGEEISAKMSEIMTERWQDPEYRALKTKQNKEVMNRPEVLAKMSGENHHSKKKYAQFDYNWLVNYCVENKVNIPSHFRSNYRKVTGAPVGTRHIETLLKENGYSSWYEFKEKVLDNYNHKVLSVEVVDCDEIVYDITVDDYHNFALSESEIFVHNSSKANLAQEDVRFSRTVNSIQRVVISELNKIATIHLFANGYEDDDLLDFTINLSNPSTVAMQQKLELIRTRFEIAGSKPEFMISTNKIYKDVFMMTDEQIREDLEHMEEDRKRQAELDAMGEGGEFGGGGGGGGLGGGGGDFGGEPLEDLGAEGGDEFGGGGGGLGGPGGDEFGDLEGGGEDLEGGDDDEEPEEDLFAGEEEEDGLLLDDEEPFDLNEDEEEDDNKKHAPIKPQNLTQQQRYTHNQQRHVNGRGRSQTVTPDLAGMNQASAFTDIIDKRHQKNPFEEGFSSDGVDVLSNMVAQQHRMSKQLERTLKSMNISNKEKDRSVLTESMSEEEEEDDLAHTIFKEGPDPEDLLIEHKVDIVLSSNNDDGEDNGEA